MSIVDYDTCMCYRQGLTDSFILARPRARGLQGLLLLEKRDCW